MRTWKQIIIEMNEKIMVRFFFILNSISVVIVVPCRLGDKAPYIVQCKGATLLLKNEDHFEMAGVWFLPSFMIDGSTRHLHLHNFDMSLKGRENFSRDNTQSKLLMTDQETFETTNFTITYTAWTRWGFGGGWNETQALRSEAHRHNH